MKKLIVFSATAALLMPMLALGAGIQVSPAELDVSGPAGKIIHQTIVVANPTTDIQLFEVSTDDFDKNIQPRPSSFTLEAGDRKTVTLDITPIAGQRLGTTISVVGHPLASARLQTNTGAKIPITVSATRRQNWPLPWWTWLAGLAILLIAGIVWHKKSSLIS